MVMNFVILQTHLRVSVIATYVLLKEVWQNALIWNEKALACQKYVLKVWYILDVNLRLKKEWREFHFIFLMNTFVFVQGVYDIDGVVLSVRSCAITSARGNNYFTQPLP